MIEIRKFLPSVERSGIESLMNDHALEVETGLMQHPNPQWDLYEALEANDATIAYAAYEGLTMVGYVIVFLTPHLHYGFIYGAHDVIYVKPEYRKSSIGLYFIRRCEDEAKKRGAKCIYWHAKPMSVFAGVMRKSKHRFDEEIYVREF
jgi:GNAT superfamily N-acetyltransferase